MSNDIKKYMAVIEAAIEKQTVQAPKKDAVLNESAPSVASKDTESEQGIVSVDSLLEAAREKGFEVLEENDIRAIQADDASIVIWENGSITQGDVPLDKMTRMTLIEAVKHLGL